MARFITAYRDLMLRRIVEDLGGQIASPLEARGLIVRTAPGSELAKAEGALTCCSLIFTESTLFR